jgi:predicted transcriptional regulator
VSVDDVRDVVNVSSAEVPDVKVLKMVKRAEVTLELETEGHVHCTDIEKKAVATCLRFATTNTVRKQFYHYLLVNGYVERVRRGVYKITSKGEKLLEILD